MTPFIDDNIGIPFIKGFLIPAFWEVFTFYSTITRTFRIYEVIIPISLLFGLY